MTLELIVKIKNILGFSSAILMISLILFKPTDIHFSLLEMLFIIIFPLAITDLVWNKWLYNGLMEDENTSYRKIGFSFKSFQLVGMSLSLILFLLMGMLLFEYVTIGVYRLK